MDNASSSERPMLPEEISFREKYDRALHAVDSGAERQEALDMIHVAWLAAQEIENDVKRSESLAACDNLQERVLGFPDKAPQGESSQDASERLREHAQKMEPKKL